MWIPRVAFAKFITCFLKVLAPYSCSEVEMEKGVMLTDVTIFACGLEDCTANAASSH